MKRILVTGGAGFIGSHLCNRLHDEGHFVICLDNLYSGNKFNVSHLLSSENFKFINQSVVEPIELDVDEIYHLACPASPVHYQKDPLFTLDTNYFGAKNVLELAKKNNAKVLLTSTSEVYGDPLVHPQEEGYFGNVNPIGIRSCYDEGKRVAETMFFDYHRIHGTKIKVARIFNTYGPKMNLDDGRVVSNFIIQAVKRNPLTVYGDGLQTRSLCYISDMIEGLIKLMNSDLIVTGPINLGNPLELTILEIANMIKVKIKSSSKIFYMDKPADDPKRRRPNIDKAKKDLGWSPIVELEEGLSLTIDYFKSSIRKEEE
jgi:UDP-glucuronate decarboxylase